MKAERPLFVPLKRAFFEAFARGEKTEEYRRHGARWNERTCRVGRAVVLSFGYGNAQRLQGVVTSFSVDGNAHQRPGWRECYGTTRPSEAAVIGIRVTRT